MSQTPHHEAHPTLRALAERGAPRAQSALTAQLNPAPASPIAPQAILHSREELHAALIALSLLEQLRSVGATPLPLPSLQRAIARVQAALSSEERVGCEIETYDILRWIGATLSPELSAIAQETPTHISPQTPHQTLLRWAIAHGEDLLAERYDPKAGKTLKERITPIALEGGAYLRAIHHTSLREERLELSRLGTLQPVNGWPVTRSPQELEIWEAAPPPRGEPHAPKTYQMSWLERVEAAQEEE